jgi:hypothetical protein
MPPQSYQGQPPQGYYYPPPRRKKERSSKPQVVGALLAVVAVLGLVGAGMGLMGWTFFGNIDEISGTDGSGQATVQGQATFLNGTGVQGVQILIIGEAMSTVTDEDGYYILYNVPTGDHKIQASKDGYFTIIRKVTVTDDSFFGPDWETPNSFETKARFTMSPGTGTVETGRWATQDLDIFRNFILVCAAIGLVASLITAMGAYFAVKRTNLSLVVVGAVAGIFTFGFFIGSVLAFVALFILLLSLDEFRTPKAAED